MSAVRASSAGDAIAVLVAWLQEEHEYGKDYFICLDSVPRDLALEIARRAANILIETGRLMLVVDDIACQSTAPINVVTIFPLTIVEIMEALAGTRADADLSAAQNILEMSNGLPFLVAGYLWLTDRSPQRVDDLGETFLDNFASALTAEERSALRFASLCDVSVPAAILRKLAPDETLRALVEKRRLLMTSEADSFHVPTILKNALNRRFEPDVLQTHSDAFDRFNELAEEQEESNNDLVCQSVTSWLREALRHGLAIMRLLDSDQALVARDPARDVANKLHSRYLIENDAVGAATAMWQEYRETTNGMGFYDDRGSDTRYAECLMRIGQYDEADSLLEAAASSDEIDDTQLQALFLRSNLIKERGRRDEFHLRIELLRKALFVASKLSPPEVDPEWIKRQTASLQHSLGNALGYGQNANPEEALQHLAAAQRAFEDLGDPLQFRTVAEQIEIRRYQHLLTPEQTQTAIATLEQNLRRLMTRGMRYDAIRHFYELGRLEEQPEKRARCYEQAYKLAGNQYQPLNWHAAIKWRISQVQANRAPFQQVVDELEGFVRKLNSWTPSAWSRRVQRNTWQFIAEHYEKLGDTQKAFAASSEAWKAVTTISEFGQGLSDLAERNSIGAFRGILALKSDNRDIARDIAAQLSEGDSTTFEHMPEGELAAWFKTVSKEEGK
jgi:tetratricopeptide (TPR) repeat protein